MEEISKKQFILKAFTEGGEYNFFPDGMLSLAVDALIELDEEYMQKSGVLDDDGVYDDDAAFEHIQAGIISKYPDYKMYAMRFVEDYLDINEDYLTETGQIEWD